MRRTIIFAAIPALLGLAAAAWASDEQAERPMRNSSQTAYVNTDDRGETAEHKMRERSVRHRADDSREHGKEAREREHRPGAYNDRD